MKKLRNVQAEQAKLANKGLVHPPLVSGHDITRAVMRMTTGREKPKKRKFKDEYKAWAEVIRRDPCSWCGHKPKWPKRNTVDHVIPRSKGGPEDHTPRNSVSACKQCNSDRGPASVLAFLAFRAGWRVEE